MLLLTKVLPALSGSGVRTVNGVTAAFGKFPLALKLMSDNTVVASIVSPKNTFELGKKPLPFKLIVTGVLVVTEVGLMAANCGWRRVSNRLPKAWPASVNMPKPTAPDETLASTITDRLTRESVPPGNICATIPLLSKLTLLNPAKRVPATSSVVVLPCCKKLGVKVRKVGAAPTETLPVGST